MIKQLILMFLAGVLVSLILQSHQLGLFYATDGSIAHILFHLACYSAGLLAISIILGMIVSAIYRIFRVKNTPKLIALGWIMWVLIMMILAGNQLYNISTHEEPVNTTIESRIPASQHKI